MKKLTLTIVFILSQIILFAQTEDSCLPEGIFFGSQQEIDNFQTNYPNCSVIEGDVIIQGEDITNLNGLSVLTSIDGKLNIGFTYGMAIQGNPSLTSLEGLSNLSYIGGGLELILNTSLASLTGFENIISIGGDVKVGANSIYNLTGLDNLTSIEGDLVIGIPLYFFGGGGGILGNPSLVNLSGLENLTSIVGNLRIGNNDSLTSLTGLEELTSIGGNLEIGIATGYTYFSGNPSLSSLAGLENLNFLGGMLYIRDNPVLTGLQGLDNLNSIGGSLGILGNTALSNLTGLENIITIGGGLFIGSTFTPNSILNSLTGLEGLNSIGGDLSILNNDALINMTGLGNLVNIGGSLQIRYNASLSNLVGLENVDANSINGLSIYDNNSLTTCNAKSICEFLLAPNGTINIHNNAPGCNNPEEVEITCEHPCPEGGVIFTAQSQIDNFQVVHPYCAEIEGEVIISGDDITNLNGLSSLTTIGGTLKILNNGNLINLMGLQNITSLNGTLYIEGNESLTNLVGLENLSTIGGTLHIEGNESLMNLWGLENIEPGLINDLIIINNLSLSACNIQNICEYLTAPGSTVQIYNNATGCNSSMEVLDHCGSCLPDGITFTTQAQIDSFPVNYGSCSKIEGDLIVDGEDISDLSSLELITYVGGTVKIGNISGNANPQLTNLSGLNNLAVIGGSLKMYSNEALTSLDELNNLGLIFGDLFIGDASFNAGNPALSSLSGLENLHYLEGSLKFSGNESLASITALNGLNFIGGQLRIKDNPVLTSLAGLGNVYSSSISYLQIISNEQLYECEVHPICSYLIEPNANIDIYDNAPGCNSQEEVEASCDSLVFVNNGISGPDFSIAPNPVKSFVIINLDSPTKNSVNICIYNTTGTCLKNWQYPDMQTDYLEIKLDMKVIPAGIYFCLIQTGNKMVMKKIIKL